MCRDDGLVLLEMASPIAIDQSQLCNNRFDRWNFDESPKDTMTFVEHSLDPCRHPDDEIETATVFLMYDDFFRHTRSHGGDDHDHGHDPDYGYDHSHDRGHDDDDDDGIVSEH